MMRISAAAHAALTARAQTEGRTLTAVLDRLVGVRPSSTLATGAGQTGKTVTIEAVTSETLCRRCKHPERKHTPTCYHAGCGCRRWQS